MGSKYYESELAYLREMGREFALVHPSTAGLLAERGSDPDVERLLEGFAFLTARIRERVDDAVPAVVHGLSQLLIPQYLRPVPSLSIIQYSPSLKALRGVHTVERGTRVASKPIQGTSCEFRTTQETDLLPVQLLDAKLDETASSLPVIRLVMETTEAGRPILLRKEGIRFLIYGELAQSAMLYHWIRRYLTGVAIKCEDAPPVELGRDVVKPVGFRRDEGTIPWPTLAHGGYRYVQEFFTLPDKFLFFDVTGLDKLLDLTSDRFEILLKFERPPELSQRLTTENFRLHCTPVVNLFEVSADPIKRDPRMFEHLVRAAGIKPNHMEVYEVTSVIGIRQGQARRRTYEPFIGYAHTADPEESSFYTLRPAFSPIDEGIDMYLSIVTPRGGTPSLEEEVLSIDIMATNRSLPSELQLGEINVSPRGVSSPAPFKNIAPVTVPLRPRLGSQLLWRLLSHMALNRQSLANAETLKATLALYNFQAGLGPSAGRANELRVESIREVTNEPVTRLMGGAPVRGVETRITVDEAKLGNAGEAYLFGCIIDEVFATHVPLNSFNELHLVMHPSKHEITWPARSGQQRIV